MNTEKAARLAELENKDAAKKNGSKTSYRTWTHSQEYMELITLRTEMKTEQMRTEAQTTPKNDWRNDPASRRQREYLASLRVRIPDNYPLTKGTASAIIDSVKSGNGVGSFGLTFTDGSN